MSGDSFGHLTYLVLLLVVVGAAFVGRDRLQLGPALRMIMVWVLIFGVVTLGYIAVNGAG